MFPALRFFYLVNKEAINYMNFTFITYNNFAWRMSTAISPDIFFYLGFQSIFFFEFRNAFLENKHVFLAHGFRHGVKIEHLRAGVPRNRVKSAIEK